MAKHVFEISSFGHCYWRGEYAGETEKMYRVLKRGVESKTHKQGLVCVEVDDPINAAETHNNTVRAAKDAALAALKGEQS